MPHVSLRVTEEEKDLMERYAKFQGVHLSDAVKNIFFEKLDDEYDLQLIKEFEEEKVKGNIEYYSLDEVEKELELDK